MDLYTLTENFLAKDVVDQYVSAIWTERFSSAGDVQLVVPATQANMEMLAPGTYLALRGTSEVMILETQSIENKLMTVTGGTLITFLNHRWVWFKNIPYTTDGANGPLIVDYSDNTRKPGAFISDVVTKMAISPATITGSYWTTAQLDWAYDAIPYLTLGPTDATGTVKLLTAVTGPLYDAIKTVAEQEGVGISLYLYSASPVTGYSLKFTTYQGKDRTSDQSTYPLIRLTPDLDTLSEVKEIHSSALYKNVCYVWYAGAISTHYAEPALPIPEGMARKVVVRTPEDEPVGHYQTQSFGGQSFTQYVPGDVPAFRAQVAKDTFANANYIQAIDGKTSPIDDYRYGVDYGLGDIIELEGLTGAISKAKVTEYIRSQDNTGEKGYPTIAVIG